MLNGTVYHKYQMQPNARNGLPSAIKNYGDKYGTHAIMVDVFIKKDGNKEDVKAGLKVASDTVSGI